MDKGNQEGLLFIMVEAKSFQRTGMDKETFTEVDNNSNGTYEGYETRD